MANERWPFCFDLDDVEVEDNPSAGRGGVIVTHRPTGKSVSMAVLSERDTNVALALRRLHRLLKDRERDGQS